MAFKVKLPTLFIGGSYRKSFLWFSQGETGERVPVDLSGKAGRIQVRKRAGDATVLADWSTENGFLKLGGPNAPHRIAITVPLEETLKYSFKEGDWDLIIWPIGIPSEAEVLLYGEIEAVKTVTRVA